MKRSQVKRLAPLKSLVILAVCLLPFPAPAGTTAADPATGPPASGTPSAKAPPPFPDISGWKRSERISTYRPDTLYEYIDGAAEAFLSFDFQELWSAEYKRETGASITADLYRFKSSLMAFGMYSQEKPPDGPFLKIGTQGYLDLPNLNLLAGGTYVKLSSFGLEKEATAVLESFARHIAAALGGSTPLPGELAAFPPDGKIPESERFSSKNFLGYGFLHSGFTADYQDSGTAFRLFLIEGTDRNDCAIMLAAFFQEANQRPASLQEGRFTIPDPNYGDVTLFWKGHFLGGVLSLTDPEKRTKYLSLLESRLQNLK